jgi:hypothetical protein
MKIIRSIKSRIVRWAGCMVTWERGETRELYTGLWRTKKEGGGGGIPLGRSRYKQEDNIKTELRKQDGRAGLD